MHTSSPIHALSHYIDDQSKHLKFESNQTQTYQSTQNQSAPNGESHHRQQEEGTHPLSANLYFPKSRNHFPIPLSTQPS